VLLAGAWWTRFPAVPSTTKQRPADANAFGPSRRLGTVNGGVVRSPAEREQLSMQRLIGETTVRSRVGTLVGVTVTVAVVACGYDGRDPNVWPPPRPRSLSRSR
jgi:hypothetical protein